MHLRLNFDSSDIIEPMKIQLNLSRVPQSCVILLIRNFKGFASEGASASVILGNVLNCTATMSQNKTWNLLSISIEQRPTNPRDIYHIILIQHQIGICFEDRAAERKLQKA